MTQPKLINFSNDSGHQMLHKIAVKHELPDYVLNAGSEDIGSPSHRSKNALHHCTHGFACHTKQSCWLSHAYFLEQIDSVDAEDRERIGGFLAKQAAFWQIESDVQKLVDTEAALIKKASESDEVYPVRNEKEAIAATKWLLNKYADGSHVDLAYSQRSDIASRIISILGEETPDVLGKTASNRLHAIAGKTPVYGVDIDSTEVFQTLFKSAEFTRDMLVDEAPEIALSKVAANGIVVLANGSIVATDTFADHRLQDVRNMLTPEVSLGGHSTEFYAKAASEADSDMADVIVDRYQSKGIRILASPLVSVSVLQ